MTKDFEREKSELVDRTVLAERNAAEDRLHQQKLSYEKKIDDVNQYWRQEMNKCVQELTDKSKRETERAVKLNTQRMEDELKRELANVSHSYEERLERVRCEGKSKLDEIDELNSRLSLMKLQNEELKKCVEEIRESFQSCIEHFTHLKKKEADFLFPLDEKLSKNLKI